MVAFPVYSAAQSHTIQSWRAWEADVDRERGQCATHQLKGKTGIRRLPGGAAASAIRMLSAITDSTCARAPTGEEM